MTMMGFLSDLHMTDKWIDEPHWDLFPQVDAIIDKHNLTELYFLGDLTTAIDRHPARLLNRLLDGLVALSTKVEKMVFLHGNHDGKTNDTAYFRLLRHIPKFRYYTEPDCEEIDGVMYVYLPHSRNPKADWADLDLNNTFVMTHVTLDKAKAESGVRVDGEIDAAFFRDTRLALSGDIHLPQIMGRVVYVGSPYNVRFGDNFDGSMLILDSTKLKEDADNCWFREPLVFPRKLSVEVKNAYQVEAYLTDFERDHRAKAQVKVKLKVDQSNIESWQQIRHEIEQVVAKHGHTHIDTEVEQQWKTPVSTEQRHQESGAVEADSFEDFCEAQGVNDKLKAAGLRIMAEAKK